MHDPLSLSVRRAALPPPWPHDLRPHIRDAGSGSTLVVLDDDPTGTQTVYDVPVLTGWSVDELREALLASPRCFYVLTNSRSLDADSAAALVRQLARNLRVAAAGRPLTVVSRSDSTLRGHYPLETDVLEAELGPYDGILLVPYFEAGGRYTLDSVHYVAEGDRLVPAAETPFARDAAFGYRHSYLPDWVEEKTRGRIPARDVASLTIELLRREGPGAVTARLEQLPAGSVCAVDAAAPADLDVLVAGLLEAERRGKRFLLRTAAQFVSARLGLEPRPLLTASDLRLDPDAGGLIVVGSYVPKTTEQVAKLRARGGLHAIELPVPALLDSASRDPLLASAARQMNEHVAAGRDVLLCTSRTLVTGSDARTSLEIGRSVSAALVALVQAVGGRPRYIVAKGGITSSDVATRGLGVRRAIVAGQLLPGIPVWTLASGSRFPDLPYIVFPGNVGGPDALCAIHQSLTLPEAPT